MRCTADVRSSCSSQAEEECLRPSLIRRTFQPFCDTANLHSASTAHCSPLQDIQALASPVPSFSGRTDHACFSPNGEFNLFGSPAPFMCTPGSQLNGRHSIAAQSPSLHQLQKEHMTCLRNLNVSLQCASDLTCLPSACAAGARHHKRVSSHETANDCPAVWLS